MADETCFIHLTDLHIADPGLEGRRPQTDTTATLAAMVKMIAAMSPKPTFVAVSGDLTDSGDPASYGLVDEMLSALGVPIVYALGNHDTRPGFYSGMLGRTEDVEAPYCHDRVIAGAHLVVLDTSVPGRIGGALDDRQFAFLDDALGRHRELPKIVVMHHAPLIGGTLSWETLDAADSERLREAVAGRKVAGILTGHVHYDRVSMWHGVPVVVGTGVHNANDILQPSGLRFVEGASFGLCTLRESGLTVAFVPLPSQRRELSLIPEEQVRGFR